MGLTMRAITLPDADALAARYAGLRLRPLRITLEIEDGSNLVSYDPLNLDNLLARRVLETTRAGDTAIACADDEYLALPVPLAVLWREPGSGLPLYAATPFAPDGAALADVVYWHKRPQEGRFSHAKSGAWSPKAAGNRFAERRAPIPVALAASWSATCVGNADAIAELLADVAAVGKRRGAGHGTVRSWRVAAVGRFGLVHDGRLARTLPYEARGALAGLVPEGIPAPVGWTPPQWRPALWRPGWRPGTPVHDIGAWSLGGAP